MITKRVLALITAERERQVAQGYTAQHDDQHLMADFYRFIQERIDRRMAAAGGTGADFRKDMVEIAALAVAALQKIDRAEPV